MVVGLEDDPEGASYLVPMTVRIDVVGEPSGEPEYAEEPADPDAPSTSTSDDDAGSAAPWLVAHQAFGGQYLERFTQWRA